MSTYREMYGNAITQLSDAYLAPAYIAAKENFFKVFETCATAGIVGIIEDSYIDPDDPEIHITQEVVDDLKREIEILRRVNYQHTKRWEGSLRFAQAQLIINA